MSEYPSQLRHSRLMDRWVLIAPGRAKRPHDAPVDPVAANKRDPFDPANINPEEVVDRIDAVDPPDGQADWQALALTNVFPLVAPGDGAAEPDLHARAMAGYGAHELVVHSPVREKDFEDFTTEQTAAVLELYQRRYQALGKLPQIRYVQLFTNRGSDAGASLRHPHSQIIALPVVPPYVEQLMRAAKTHHATAGQDVAEDEAVAEVQSNERVVAETEHFIAYCPFASLADYHIRIFPRRPGSHFELSQTARADLAALWNAALGALGAVAHAPAYNAFVRTAPVGEQPPGFRWHVDVVPHLATPGGLELATGLSVLTVFPEAAADRLRAALPTV